MRRLVVCLDGTWNLRDHTTNIWRIYSLIKDIDPNDGTPQKKYYHHGVGTRWYDRVSGGAFGAGTYTNVKDAYNWLAEQYEEDDQIFLFGFSRGALTALSLANLIDRCGLIGGGAHNTFEDAYRLYKLTGFTRETPASVRFRRQSADWPRHHPHKPPLHFLGLFDTVASLYASRCSGESMHILNLPESVTHVFHAIAIDEIRRPFQSVCFPTAPKKGHLTERWFSGAHANVGGGYAFDPLCIIPLKWMIEAATKSGGLAIGPPPSVDIQDVLYVKERDSFNEFAYGVPAFIPFSRKYRLIGRPPSEQEDENAEEWVDESAVARYQKFSGYRASSIALRNYFTRHDYDFDNIRGDIDVRSDLRSDRSDR